MQVADLTAEQKGMYYWVLEARHLAGMEGHLRLG